MFTKSSRNALCFLLSFIMAVSVCAFIGSTAVKVTLCSQNYLEHFLSTQKIEDYSTEIYNQRIAVLSDNSGIPLRVFEVVENIDGYEETVVSRFFSDGDTTIFTKDRIETYEKLIKEYLDGNEISYEEEDVYNTAVEAAKIYSDSYGVKNVGAFKSFIEKINDVYAKVSSIALIVFLIAAVFLFILFNDKKKTIAYYAGAFSAAGISCVLISLLSLIFGIGKGGKITPEIYQDAIFSAINCMFLILILIGVIITAISTVSSLRYHKLTKKTKNK